MGRSRLAIHSWCSLSLPLGWRVCLQGRSFPVILPTRYRLCLRTFLHPQALCGHCERVVAFRSARGGMSAAWNLATQSQQLHLAQHTCNGDRAETGTENPSVWLITRKMLDKVMINRMPSIIPFPSNFCVYHQVHLMHAQTL